MIPSIVHRALVTYSNENTGEIRVKVPAVTGLSEIPISYIARKKQGNSWVVPATGSQIVVSADDDSFTNLFWVHTDSAISEIGKLDDLSDVTVPSPVNGDILSWDGSQWVNIENFAEATKHYVKNDTGAVLPIGSAVYTYSANGTNILVRKAQANTESTSATILGVMAETLGVNEIGKVVTQGLIAGFNTSSANAGDPVWLSPTVAGGLSYGLANKPSAPNHLVYIGVVTRSQINNGEIFVNISNGWELEELHNVSSVSPSVGDTLKWNGSLWVNSSSSDTPTGSITAFAGTVAPSGWLLCDGRSTGISRTTYATLFGVIGTTYGPGDGSTTFNLPDLRGRVIAGVDNMGGTAANRLTNTVLSASNQIGATGGSQTHTLTSNEMPSHSHTINGETVQAQNFSDIPINVIDGAGTGYATYTETTANAGGGLAHLNTQPTMVLSYIIKT